MVQRVIPSKAIPTQVQVNNLNGNELICYKSKTSDAYSILAKLNAQGPPYTDSYGFVSLKYSDNYATYRHGTWREAVEAVAATGREVYAFYSMFELIKFLNEQLNKKSS